MAVSSAAAGRRLWAARMRKAAGAAPGSIARDALIVFAIAFLGSWFGLETRELGFLASFWPPNAILLAAFVRVPRLAHPRNWLVALAGYMLAELFTDDSLGLALSLTATNLTGVAFGLAAFALLPPTGRLRRPWSILWVGCACGAQGVGAALIGTWIGINSFGQEPAEAALTWFAAEVSASMAVIPVILAAPPLRRVGDLADALFGEDRGRSTLATLLALVATLAIGVAIGGPAAITFPVPALLLGALTTDVFRTTVLTLISTAWTMTAVVSTDIELLGTIPDRPTVLSIQLGLTLLAMAPIAVAANVFWRDEALRRLHSRADRDSLTGALNREAFFERGGAVLAGLRSDHRPISVLMLDLDHFKAVNDTLGHPMGDRVLEAFAAVVEESLRDTDLFGRIGGEEFAIVLPGPLQNNAEAVAERIRATMAERVITGPEDHSTTVTVSIGISTDPDSTRVLSDMLAAADTALYKATRAGRDQVVAASPAENGGVRGGQPLPR